jgi:hypothetical protein
MPDPKQPLGGRSYRARVVAGATGAAQYVGQFPGHLAARRVH